MTDGLTFDNDGCSNVCWFAAWFTVGLVLLLVLLFWFLPTVCGMVYCWFRLLVIC